MRSPPPPASTQKLQASSSTSKSARVTSAELITRYARDIDADLIVVGHKGHFLNDYLLGSTADRVAHHAHCPVMIVKPIR